LTVQSKVTPHSLSEALISDATDAAMQGVLLTDTFIQALHLSTYSICNLIDDAMC